MWARGKPEVMKVEALSQAGKIRNEKRAALGSGDPRRRRIPGGNSPCHQEIGRLAETQQSWGAGRYFRFWRAAISSSMLTSSVG